MGIDSRVVKEQHGSDGCKQLHFLIIQYSEPGKYDHSHLLQGMVYYLESCLEYRLCFAGTSVLSIIFFIDFRSVPIALHIHKQAHAHIPINSGSIL